MKLQEAIKKIPSEEYPIRIPKMIQWLYATAEAGEVIHIKLSWFSDPDAALVEVKTYLSIVGLNTCCLSNDYKNIRIEKNVWTEQEIREATKA